MMTMWLKRDPDKMAIVCIYDIQQHVMLNQGEKAAVRRHVDLVSNEKQRSYGDVIGAKTIVRS
jgi:hypothetical protein